MADLLPPSVPSPALLKARAASLPDGALWLTRFDYLQNKNPKHPFQVFLFLLARHGDTPHAYASHLERHPHAAACKKPNQRHMLHGMIRNIFDYHSSGARKLNASSFLAARAVTNDFCDVMNELGLGGQFPRDMEMSQPEAFFILAHHLVAASVLPAETAPPKNYLFPPRAGDAPTPPNLFAKAKKITALTLPPKHAPLVPISAARVDQLTCKFLGRRPNLIRVMAHWENSSAMAEAILSHANHADTPEARIAIASGIASLALRGHVDFDKRPWYLETLASMASTTPQKLCLRPRGPAQSRLKQAQTVQI